MTNNNRPNTPPIIATINKAAPLVIGGVVLYSFFHKKRDKIQDALMWSGIAAQLYRFIDDAKRGNDGDNNG
jgi:hypothetical protein